MGARLRMAANHWQLAIETHAQNFPDADHDCADVSQVDPRRYPSTDILLASPECTHHSIARSKKHTPDLFNPNGDPAAERSRATMWDIPRFAEQHRYQFVLVENVVEVARWEPFDSWLGAMESLGYRHKLLSLNSAIAPGAGGAPRPPQLRDRLYVAFWRAGNREPDLDFRPDAYCWACEGVVEAVQSWKRPDRRVGKYRQQYVYRCPTCNAEASPLVAPALAALDLSIPCPRIGDRARPLAAATRRRIEVGLERFVWPVMVQAAGHTYERPGSDYVRAWGSDQPMPAQTTTLQHGIAVPAFFVKNYGGEAEAKYRAHPIDSPLGAITTSDSHALVVPLRRNGRARPAGREPLPVFAAGGQHHAVVVIKNYGDGNDPSMAHSPLDPLGAVTTKDHHSVLSLPFLTTYYGNGGVSSTDEPIPTVTTRDRAGLVQPAIEVDDCGFRMLEPHEIGRGMAFPDSYEVKGTKRDKVKQYGNAVTPPVPTMVLRRAVEALAA